MYNVHHIRRFWVFALVSVIDLLYFSAARCLLSISILLILPPPPTQLLFLLSQFIQLCDFATDDILWKRIGGGGIHFRSTARALFRFIQCVSPQIAKNRFYLFHMYPKPSRWTCSVVRLTQFKVILILCVVY